MALRPQTSFSHSFQKTILSTLLNEKISVCPWTKSASVLFEPLYLKPKNQLKLINKHYGQTIFVTNVILQIEKFQMFVAFTGPSILENTLKIGLNLLNFIFWILQSAVLPKDNVSGRQHSDIATKLLN